MGDFTREAKRACLVRELRLRKRAYPRWVAQGKMKERDAEREIACLEDIIADYGTGQEALDL